VHKGWFKAWGGVDQGSSPWRPWPQKGAQPLGGLDGCMVVSVGAQVLSTCCRLLR